METKGFDLVWRNPGHWDIVKPGGGREFTIRGEPGAVWVCDERAKPYPRTDFKSVQAALAFVADHYIVE